MYFLAINRIKPDVEPREVGAAIAAHIAWTRRMISEGKMVQAGKWGNDGGMAIIRADCMGEARSILDQDPLVTSALVAVEVARLHPDVEIP
ncbi:MAG: hypothetical protein HYX75_19750 [Acidobacteria bacterium]|nr:hypothetical protein [Acidobacteriota bacterium]